MYFYAKETLNTHMANDANFTVETILDIANTVFRRF